MSNKYIVEVWLDKDGWHKKQSDFGKWTHPGRPETITVGPRGSITIEGSPSETTKHNFDVGSTYLGTVGSLPPTT